MCNYEVVMRPGATCGDVVQGARDLVDKTLEKDVVLFYVSTHGSNPDKHEGKLLLSFDDGLLDVKDFMGELEKLSSTKVMILIHSCFAGAALLSHETNGGDMPTNDITHSNSTSILEELGRKSGKVTICAGPPDLLTYGQIFPDAVRDSSWTNLWLQIIPPPLGKVRPQTKKH